MKREDDLLERATRALRETATPTSEELAEGRARLLWAQRSAARQKRMRRLRWVLPLAAVLTAGSALAATTGQFERVARVVSEWLAPATSEVAKSRPKAKHAKPEARDAAVVRSVPPEVEPSVAAADAGALQPAPESPATPEPAVAEAPRKSRAREKRDDAPREVAPIMPSEPPAPVEASAPELAPEPPPALRPSPDLAGYREAHRLHFRVRDFASALRAWDDYLARHPTGTFAIEARYNRAICLLRLGQKAEARRALEPFARGVVGGGYRKREAAELLEALE